MSFTYPAGILSKTPVTPAGPYAEGAASGVWKLNEIAYWVKQGLWPQAGNPTPNDPYFQYVTSLLHGDGTNGGQNNTFVDSSTNAFSITRNGNTTQGSFSPYGSNWGNYFNGSSDYFDIPSSASISSGFTMECWCYPTVNNGNYQIAFTSKQGGGSYDDYVSIHISSTGYWRFNLGNAANYTSSSAVAFNTWTHVAVSNNGSTTYLFVNGTLIYSTAITPTSTALSFRVGAWSDSSLNPNYYFKGYVSNARVTNTCLYTAAFTPSTTPLTAVSGTQVLTCQSNRFIDTSSNAYALTVNGTPQVSRFSPFAPTYSTQYSTSTIGGSGYFDGSTSTKLSLPAQTSLSGDFTVEGWFYTTGTNGVYDQTIFSNWPAAGSGSAAMVFQLGHSPSSLTSTGVYWGSVSGSGNLSFTLSQSPINQWSHFAITRSGSSMACFFNGVRVSTTTNSNTLTIPSGTVIGNYTDNSEPFLGYISDLRIVNGSAVYSPSNTSITLPTAPLTAVSNTQFLANMTNAAIYDNAMIPDYQTVGNAQINTTTKKYGTGSMSFDGSTSVLSTPASPNLSFGTGNFTVEFWFNTSITSGSIINGAYQGPFNIGAQDGAGTLQMYYAGTTVYVEPYGATAITFSSSLISTNTWYHVAICRAAGTLKLFLNGTQIGSVANSTNLNNGATNGMFIGARGSNKGYMPCYIDDFRITNGYARYWENFTPPAAALPNFGGAYQVPTQDPQFNYTTLLLPGNGTNGAQNNTFLDSSTNAFTITRNGNTTQGTFTPFSQTGWSNYFGGNSYLNTPSSTASAVDFSGAYTIEGWFYLTATPGAGYYGAPIISTSSGSGNNWKFWGFSSTNTFTYATRNAAGFNQITVGTLPLNQWFHFAFVMGSSTTGTAFINGTQVATTTDSTSFSGQSGYNVVIGDAALGGTNYFNGYMSSLRFSNNARYSSNFTPSTTALTSDANTTLLTCQNNRFLDNSSNNYAISSNGNTQVQAFSPFAPTAAYSTSVVGGSGYFDGSGDSLDLASNSANAFGTGDFTVEAWIYPTTWTYGAEICDGSTNGFALGRQNATNNFGIAASGTAWILTYGTLPSLNTWTHVAVSRSGTTLRLYYNGVSVASTTDSTSYTAINKIGGDSVNNLFWFNGYISNFRAVKGTAVYTGSSFTVPTSLVTNVAGTGLLLNYTNAGITDATAKNDLETVGNAQISTTQSKFGGSSMYFNATGDYLKSSASLPYSLAPGDFTIEFWMYTTSLSAVQRVIAYINDPSTSAGYSYIIDVKTDGYIKGVAVVSSTENNVLSASGVAINTWNHVAFVKYGTTYTTYLNGVGGTPSTISNQNVINNGNLYVGTDFNGNFSSPSAPYKGYINDLRITKGYARYVQNFTPPTTADQLY